MIEKGTHLRIKLIGTRSDVGSMFAIGSIKEDFLGFGAFESLVFDPTDRLAGLYNCPACFAYVLVIEQTERGEGREGMAETNLDTCTK